MNKFARTSLVAGALSAAVTVAVGFAPTASAVVQHSTMRLVDKNSKCLGSYLGHKNTTAIQWSCNHNNDQEWSLKRMGTDRGWGAYYKVVNKDGQCLGIYGYSKARGVNGTVWNCNGNPDQLWYFEQGHDGWGGLVNRNSKLCLGSQNGITKNGTKQIQWSCNGNPDQLWKQKV